MIRKREAVLSLAGLLAGVAILGVAQDLRSGSAVEEVIYPRQERGALILGGDTVLIGRDTELKDLPELANSGNETTERYQAVVLGEDDFLILDTRTGLARRYERASVTVYSSTVPNHALRLGMQVHHAVED